MAEQQGDDINEAVVLDMPVTAKEWHDYLYKERYQVVQYFAQRSKKPDFDALEDPKYMRLQVYLRRLEYLEMTPKIKADTQLDKLLGLFNNPLYEFPEADKAKARGLLDNWESERWGANEVIEEEQDPDTEEEETEPAPKRRKQSSSTQSPVISPSASPALLPPPNHPIFGRDGIMHGIALKRGARRVPILDPRYVKRPTQVYGHNGLAVGAWFPLQLVALFRGAHGVTQGGIAGNQETGAYSIVISGYYDDLDRDSGDKLYYSGSNSHSNTDPDAPAPSSRGTRSLEASWTTQKPIRVLRAASGKGKWAPIRGLRYDGLYRVVEKAYPKNLNGGMYERFELVRLEGQPEINTARPNKHELRDYEKIPLGY